MNVRVKCLKGTRDHREFGKRMVKKSAGWIESARQWAVPLVLLLLSLHQLRSRWLMVDHMDTRQPNIVFILTDDQDATLGSVQTMPNVMRLSKEGVVCRNHYATVSLCCPSPRESLARSACTVSLGNMAIREVD